MQSQSNEPKNMLGDCQNLIKTIILLDIFLWCLFNAMLIMECCVKWLMWMLSNSKKNSKTFILGFSFSKGLWTWTTITSKAINFVNY